MIDKTQKAALRQFAGKRSKAELKALFALVRANEDSALLAAITPPRRPAPKRGDTLVTDIEAILKPLMARSAEKGELLIAHLLDDAAESSPRGLADAIRKLRAAKLTDRQIRAGAARLMAELKKRYDGRESVV